MGFRKDPHRLHSPTKAYVCGRSPAKIGGLNPAGGMDVCCECCVLGSLSATS